MKYSSCVCAITAGASLIIVYLSSPTWIGDPTTVASLVAFKIGWPHHLQAAAGLEKTRLHNYMMGPSAVDYEPKVDPSDGKLWTYRLGDVYGSPAFKIEFTNELRAKTISLFSTTIAARYARRVTPGKKSDAPLLTNVTLTWCDKNLPHNFFSKYERVVHLRLGDALIHPSPQFSPDPPNVFALKYWYAINQRPALQKDISRSRVAQRHPLKTITVLFTAITKESTLTILFCLHKKLRSWSMPLLLSLDLPMGTFVEWSVLESLSWEKGAFQTLSKMWEKSSAERLYSLELKIDLAAYYTISSEAVTVQRHALFEPSLLNDDVWWASYRCQLTHYLYNACSLFSCRYLCANWRDAL